MEQLSIIEFFSVVSDPRIERSKKHPLISVLMIGLMSVLAGGEGYNDMEEYGEVNEKLLRDFLDLSNGIPSHDTFRNVFSRINPKELEEFLLEFTKHLSEGFKRCDSNVIALDGKTVRGSYDKAREQNALHLVSAWAAGTRLVLGQVAVDGKSNEITAIPKLLQMLDIKGATITMDAMGTQREIAKQIIDKKADYVLALKKNHGTFHEDVTDFFSGHAVDNFSELEHTSFETTDKGHGRIEIRTTIATDEIEWSGRDAEWKGLKSFVMVRGSRIIGDREKTEARYYISSLPATASNLAEAVRSHWGIENDLHWMLDVNFREDQSRIRRDNGPRNMAALRKVALNLLKASNLPKKSLRRKKLLATWSPKYLLSLILQRN